jgi:hypothetical protein
MARTAAAINAAASRAENRVSVLTENTKVGRRLGGSQESTLVAGR